jgi:PRC-barrel domain
MMKAWIVGALVAGLAVAEAAAQAARPGNEAVDRAILTVEEMTGAPVFGPSGEQFGAVGSLVIDPQGKVEAALVDLGGFMGIATKQVILPLDSLEIERETVSGAVRVYSAATVDELDAMPGVD